ncbi:hypothetical protein AGMMS50262_02800 [Bacteroidia bacterium]|nr:hypothetical protein AGMMS50262_02800 [Bacteroidia bacterium]
MFRVKKLWFADGRMYIENGKKEQLSVAVSRFPRLLHANNEQRMAWKQFHDGLRWEEIDEDIHLNSFLYAENDKNIVHWI